MSSRSLAAARARRTGENAPPVSGNRPVTSIGSQAAFAQQLPRGVGYNMPPPPNNVRVAKAMQPPQQYGNQPPKQYQQFYEQEKQNSQSGTPFKKLSISDAVGLITLRLGRVEQWIIETDNDEERKQGGGFDIPENHKVIDNSVLTSIVNRIDSLEKNTGTVTSNEDVKKITEEVATLREQLKRVGEDVSKHTIELAKNTEQVFRFNRELVETKDILKTFMIKYDEFVRETTQNFSDYDLAFSDFEKRIGHIDEPIQEHEPEVEAGLEATVDNNVNESDGENNVIMSVDLKNIIKQELGNM